MCCETVRPCTTSASMCGAGLPVYGTSAGSWVNLAAPFEIWADVLRDTTAMAHKPADQERRLGVRLSSTVPVSRPPDPSLQTYVDQSAPV